MSPVKDRPRPIGAGAPVLTPRNQAKAQTLGMTSATGLVMGSIVGVGVFTMPAVLAGAGTMSLLVLGAIAIGALILAVLFGQLVRRVPHAEGGLYAYARHEYGDFPAYIVGWFYWINCWAGNAAIVASWVFYVEAFFNISHPSHMENFGIAMVGLWIPAIINLIGLNRMAWIQNATVVLKFVPLLLVGIVGWFFIRSANFGPFNASGGSLYNAIGIGAAVALFAFIGVEAAAITAHRVRDPHRNVPRASVYGTIASAVVYLLTSAVVMGLVAHKTLVTTGSPFVNAVRTMFPGSPWAPKLIAALAIVSGFGVLIAWTLLNTETSRAMADDDLFPKSFAWADRRNTAWFGIVVGAILPSFLMLWDYTTKSGLTVWTYLVDLTVVAVAVPYFVSALAQVTYLVSRRRQVHGWLLARDLTVAGIGALFSIWVMFANSYQVLYQSFLVMIAGLLLFAFMEARRERLGEVPEPVDLVVNAEPVPPPLEKSA